MGALRVEPAPAPARAPVYTRAPGLASWATGLPEIALGVAFLVTWVDPDRLGHDMVSFALELMLLEFILIHSAGFMGVKSAEGMTTRDRVLGIVGLGLFYSLFVGGFCLGLHRVRPLISFWIVTAQRLAGDLLDPKPSDETRAWFGTNLAINAVSYILLVGATVMLPLPRLGITRSVQAELGISGEGLWQSDPHRVVILAGAYYLIRGLLTATARPRKAFPPDQTVAGTLKRAA
jgi:hypothetical protein